MMLCAALAAVVALPGRASAQPSFADSAERLVMAGQQASEQRSRDSLERSIQLFQLALAQLNGAHQQGRAGAVLNNLGLVYRDLPDTDSAIVYFRRALDVRRQVRDRTGEGTTLYNLGVVLYDRGRADTALVYLQAALDVQVELGDRPAQAAALGAIGLAHQALSRADSADAYMRRALAIARELRDGRLEARTMEFLGSVQQTLGRPDSAEFYSTQAQEIHRALGDVAGEVAARVGGISLVPGDSALAGLYQTLEDVRKVMDHRREGTVLDLIGTAHHAAGCADSALSYYAQARTIQRRLGDPRSEGATLTHIALVHAGRGHADSALAYFRWALPLLRGVGDRREEAAALGNMGIVYHSAGTQAGMARAVAYYDSAAAVLAEVGRSVGGDESRLSFARMNVPLFDAWVLAWLARDRQVGERRAAYAALAAAERGRAQSLRQLMQRRTAPEPGAPSGLAHTAPGADLPAEGRALATALELGGVTAVSYVVTDETLIAFLVRPGRPVEVFRTPVAEETLARLVARVRTGLKVDSADSRLRAPGGVPGASPPVDPSGTGEPEEDSGAWRAPADTLAELLFPYSLRERLPASGELVIVPSGPLFLLPFAVLPLPSQTLLGVRYAIRYAPSLQVIADLGPSPGIPNLVGGPLVVGDPTMPRTSPANRPLRLARLAGARAEGAWVAERVGAHALTDSAASEAAVRERLATAPLIHLATHALAYASEARARESFVALAPGGGQDGLLTVAEVMDELPDMRAELVVLSACQTGLGNLNQAEGTIGLQRAFLARGVRAVLVSQWSVDDKATALLMQNFYINWLSGLDKAEALRLAQLDVADVYPNPRYWAAFQIVGVR